MRLTTPPPIPAGTTPSLATDRRLLAMSSATAVFFTLQRRGHSHMTHLLVLTPLCDSSPCARRMSSPWSRNTLSRAAHHRWHPAPGPLRVRELFDREVPELRHRNTTCATQHHPLGTSKSAPASKQRLVRPSSRERASSRENVLPIDSPAAPTGYTRPICFHRHRAPAATRAQGGWLQDLYGGKGNRSETGKASKASAGASQRQDAGDS